MPHVFDNAAAFDEACDARAGGAGVDRMRVAEARARAALLACSRLGLEEALVTVTPPEW